MVTPLDTDKIKIMQHPLKRFICPSDFNSCNIMQISRLTEERVKIIEYLLLLSSIDDE